VRLRWPVVRRGQRRTAHLSHQSHVLHSLAARPRHAPSATWHGRLSGLVLNHKTTGVTDWCLRERLANVATSAPFFLLAHRVLTRGDSIQTRQYGLSLLGVGAAAVAYHASSGPSRPHFRQLDYTAIAASSVLLLRALRTGNVGVGASAAPAGLRNGISKSGNVLATLLQVASIASVPLHPLASAGAHGAACEAVFFGRARGGGVSLRRDYARHVALSVVASALFVGEEIVPEVPFIHAIWHVGAAVALAGFEAALPMRR
jgi:hypothetical protein